MTHVFKHLRGHGANIDFFKSAAQAGGQVDSVAFSAGGGGKTGHGDGDYVAARAAQAVHGTRGHNQRMGGVQAARNPDHQLGVADSAQALLQSGHLDRVGLIAVLG